MGAKLIFYTTTQIKGDVRKSGTHLASCSKWGTFFGVRLEGPCLANFDFIVKTVNY